MEIFSVNDVCLFPEQTSYIHTSRNCSVFIRCQGHALLIHKKNSDDIINEDLLVTRTSFSELKIRANHKPIRLSVLIFDESILMSKIKNNIYSIKSMPEEIIKLADKLIINNIENDTTAFSFLIREIQLHILNLNEDFPVIKNKIDPRLIKINRYLRQNYKETITLQLLSDMVHVNPVYLSNSYSHVFKISPIHHLNTYRINESKKLLCSLEKSLSSIAESVGFSSSSHFCATFKRYTSMSPAEYRQQLKIEPKKELFTVSIEL
ncbi:hypothetical protein Back11_39350 [Paenibacillus baekrokdamisoli]|uniref:Uncharacterized protein n=1 Tax=Paenibacillus baekrokdamisoli TaxID=1712516 RepID=A0A3G9IUW8_9BACL|nr:AraC family transcriptional regulator [Paenibacillus baekrokdamisoli]MBB3068365.1 AraC-like DNA-binding protein [Paenibacillus baekrokdamisoli]BBH22590.1 hypothetical protein Back11_39350 [Paenibacillus baekrokdamisoli]